MTTLFALPARRTQRRSAQTQRLSAAAAAGLAISALCIQKQTSASRSLAVAPPGRTCSLAVLRITTHLEEPGRSVLLTAPRATFLRLLLRLRQAAKDSNISSSRVTVRAPPLLSQQAASSHARAEGRGRARCLLAAVAAPVRPSRASIHAGSRWAPGSGPPRASTAASVLPRQRPSIAAACQALAAVLAHHCHHPGRTGAEELPVATAAVTTTARWMTMVMLRSKIAC